jgi:hypothetical protein
MFVDKLVNLMKTIARESGNRKKKIERLRLLLSDLQSHKLNLSSFDPLPFPLDPEQKIVGVVPERSTIFKVLHRTRVLHQFFFSVRFFETTSKFQLVFLECECRLRHWVQLPKYRQVV